jgi:hypothetical protein
MIKFRSILKKSTGVLLTLVMILTLLQAVLPVPVLAGGTDFSLPATGGLQVNVMNGESPVLIANLSLTELQGWEQHEERYSAIDSMPEAVGALASGVYLSEVLQYCGISNTADVASIKMYATDEEDREFSYDYLWGSTRSFYPDLVPTWDENTHHTGSGADNNPEAVEPMFALISYQERMLDLKSPSTVDAVRPQMEWQNTLRFYFGQTAADIQNDTRTASDLFKWVYRMDITLAGGATQPEAKPSAALLSPPWLSASYTTTGTVTGTVGQTADVNITYTSNNDWLSAITEITVNGTSLTSGEQYNQYEGIIVIDADVFPAAGTYQIVVKADGYTDNCATWIMRLPPPLTTPSPVLNEGVLSWTAIYQAVGYEVTLTPTTGSPTTQTTTEISLDLTSLSLADGIYSVTVKALAEPGSVQHSDSAASTALSYQVGSALPAPSWIADSTNNIVGETIVITYTPADSAYNQAISGVSVNDTPIDSGLYDKAVDGQLTLNASLFTTAGDYVILISADGYMDASVTQPVFNEEAALAILDLSGSPSLTYNAEPLYYVLTNLTLTGKDQYGEDYDISGQTVTWQVHSGQATVLGNTLTINAAGTVTVSATIGGITSNHLDLIVGSTAGIPNPGHPDEIILSWTGDPGTTQTVSWRTGTDTTQNQIQYLPVSSYSGNFNGAQSETAVQSTLYEDNYHFEVTLQGLNPATRYIYRVGCEGAWSEPSYFTTADTKDSDFSFIYMGDVQEGIDNWVALIQNIYAQNPNLKFGLQGGDIVRVANSTSEWERFLTGASTVFSQIPLMPTAGNHDEPDINSLYDYPLYWNSFALPENGPDGYTEQFYSFDYGNCHIIVLDSNVMGTLTASSPDYEKISTWLQNDLNDSNQTWKLAVFHHPAYPVVSDADSSVIQQYWAPLLEQCGVDMAFVGHQHVYMRTAPMYDGQVTDSQQGTVYVIGNSGSKHYPAGTGEEFQYYIEVQMDYVTNYQLVNIDGNTLTLVTKNAQGNVIDSYVINKPAAAYTVTPVADEDNYQTGAKSDGINTMTVKPGVSGIIYFSADVTPVTGHKGEESVVFIHTRKGEQIGINIVRVNFDVTSRVQAGFDVQPGDVVEVYVMDTLDSLIDGNPNIFLLQTQSLLGKITATSCYCGKSMNGGDAIRFSGTTDANTWLGIKIVDNTTHEIVFFQAVKSGNDGKYNCTFSIPNATGKSLSVVVGSGYNVVILALYVNPTGDLNGDLTCDITDLVCIGFHWGEKGTAGWIPEDVNLDGEINVCDLVKIGLNWGGD